MRVVGGDGQAHQALAKCRRTSQASAAIAATASTSNAAVSSRVQKLFGGGSVKIDPTYVGTVGSSSARIFSSGRHRQTMPLHSRISKAMVSTERRSAETIRSASFSRS